MPDNIDQTAQPQTPGALLAGDMPLYARPGEPPSLPVAQPQPTPQQIDHHRHAAIGRAASFLFGQERDPNTGERVKQAPGAVFRSLLVGALLGGAIGSEGPAVGSGGAGSFLAGLSRGAAGVEQQTYQRQQDEFARQRQTQQMSLEERRFKQEQIEHQATLEHWNMENLARGREADYRDREWLQREQAQDNDVQKWAIQNSAHLASIPGNAVPGNGPKLMRDMVNNPQSFQAPSGHGRLLIKHFDFTGLDHDEKNGWTENGKPVDWSRHLQWDIYYVPLNAQSKKQVVMPGADWEKYYGVKGLDPNQNYSIESVSSLVGAATTQRKNQRESANQDFKERHDALNATIQAARTNVTQLESEKRELLGHGYSEGDDEVQEIEEKIVAEKKREQDAIDEMHPRIRERVTKTPPKPATAAPAGSGAPKPTFSPSKWQAANPNGDVNAAIEEAKRQGYQVIQ